MNSGSIDMKSLFTLIVAYAFSVQRNKHIGAFKKILLALIFILTTPVFGYEGVYKNISEPFSVIKSDPSESINDMKEDESGSNSTDLEFKPNQEGLTIIRKFQVLLKNEIDRFGCKFVHEKYIIKRTVPKFYNSQYNWNKPSKFNIKDFESTILNCINKSY